jgi:tetratricopeptide (TPR) repeat protein
VKGAPANIQSEGVRSAIYFHGQEAGMAQVYGDETGKMMRHSPACMGCRPDKFFLTLKNFVQQNTWKSVSTDDFRSAAAAAFGQSLDYFSIQWIGSSGAPEFKLDYTVFRVTKGFRVMGKFTQDLDTFRMPVTLKEDRDRPQQSGAALRSGRARGGGHPPRRAVHALSEFGEALREYQKALETNRTSSLANYRIAEAYFLQNNYQEAANKFRAALDGDLNPKWTEVWGRIHLGWIYDISGQRDRAVDQYNQAIRTKDDTQGAQEEATKYLKTPYLRERRADDR